VHEVELKLGAPPGFGLPDLSGVAEAITPRPAESARLRTTYWDTQDLRLARWGCSLRLRAGEGWTVKLPGEVAAGVLARPEVTVPGPPNAPPEAAVDLLRAFVRTERLEPVARLWTLRHRIDLVRDGSVPAATVCLDDVAVVEGRRVAHRFREVEVELAAEPPDGLLDAVRHRLVAAGAGEPDPTPKLLRALGEGARGGPDVPDAAAGPGGTTGEVVGAAIASSVRRLILHDPGVRLGEDPEAVHQCRVATRRLRSDLRTFRPYLAADHTEPVRDELRWLGAALGAVRDADVLLARLRGLAQDVADDDRPAADRLLARLEGERGRAGDDLLATLGQDRYVALLETLVALARDPSLVGDADRPAAGVLAGLIDRPWNLLQGEVAGLSDPPSDEELHQVRIRTKRCRYAAEAVAPVAGTDAAVFAKATAGLQDVLGEHQDAAVAETWLRTAGPSAGGRQAFVAGLLAGRLRVQRAEARESFPRAWKRVRKKGPDRWA
jgi:CHAD domain-containing protein